MSAIDTKRTNQIRLTISSTSSESRTMLWCDAQTKLPDCYRVVGDIVAVVDDTVVVGDTVVDGAVAGSLRPSNGHGTGRLSAEQ
jgi:hypothetical protein